MKKIWDAGESSLASHKLGNLCMFGTRTLWLLVAVRGWNGRTCSMIQAEQTKRVPQTTSTDMLATAANT